jgi:hypothetical protein
MSEWGHEEAEKHLADRGNTEIGQEILSQKYNEFLKIHRKSVQNHPKVSKNDSPKRHIQNRIIVIDPENIAA